MQQLILIIHVLVAIAIIALVLLQHGRGADVGASFGSGASNTMFGSAGALPFLVKVTVVCAAIFFATSITLNFLSSRHVHQVEKLSMPALPALSVTQTTQAALTPEKSENADVAALSFAPTEKK